MKLLDYKDLHALPVINNQMWINSKYDPTFIYIRNTFKIYVIKINEGFRKINVA